MASFIIQQPEMTITKEHFFQEYNFLKLNLVNKYEMSCRPCFQFFVIF